MGIFNKTIIIIIIPLLLVGYEMIIANSALRASLATCIYHLIYPARTRGIINIVNYHMVSC